MDGAELDVKDGARGETLGAVEVRVAVGEIDGEVVRKFTVGKTLGDVVLETVGDEVGKTLGDEVGKILGDEVGKILGDEVMETLGDVVGEALGVAVYGAPVGESVG